VNAQENTESEEAQPREQRVKFVVTYGGQTTDEEGLVTLRWKAPASELAYASQAILMVDQNMMGSGPEKGWWVAGVRFVDEETNTQKVVRIGKVKFKRLVVNEKGDVVLHLKSDTRSLALRFDQMGLLTNRSMELVLKEILEQRED